MDGVKHQDSTPQNDSTLGFKWIKKIAQNIVLSYIHNDHTYITGDHTKLCLNIICNRSFFYFEMMSALFQSEFYTRMKRYWDENISIYRMHKLLFTILM
jgi:hypothetical protein